MAIIADRISLGCARSKPFHPSAVRLSQPGRRQEKLPKNSSARRRTLPETRDVNLLSLERSSEVFMRGIRAPRQNLSENLAETGPALCMCLAPSICLAPRARCHCRAWGNAPGLGDIEESAESAYQHRVVARLNRAFSAAVFSLRYDPGASPQANRELRRWRCMSRLLIVAQLH